MIIAMEYISIRNLQFKNMEITVSLNKKEIFAVYSRDPKKSEEFFLLINGINPNNGTCLYENKDIFDNEDFFKQRIYLDFKETYFKTMNIKVIEETLANKYNISFNPKIFNTYVQTMGIRMETIVDTDYIFTECGNSMINFAFLKALNKPFVTINNPTIYLQSIKILELVIQSLTYKGNYEGIILGLDKIKRFKDKLDRVLIFTEYETYVIIDPRKDSFLLIEDNIYLHDKLFRINESNMVICLNKYSKEEIKKFNNFKIKHEKFSFYELEDYFGDYDGK